MLAESSPRSGDHAGVDEDDLALTGAQHRQERLGQEKRDPQVGAVEGVELRDRRRFARPGGEAADAVDQHVDTARPFFQLSPEPLDLVVDGQIRRVDEHLGSGLPRRGRDRLQPVSIAAHQTHPGSASRQGESDRLADAARRSGDHRRLTFKSWHS